ncbi:MAG TPA: GNAT family N-acetyltransferase, partial [Bacteroidales bacterium]|nr:GNAT family N-acetyltransferase [Bacteroidales bacterium]
HYILETFAAYREEAVKYEHFNKFIDPSEVLCGFAVKDTKDTVVGFCLLEPYGAYSTFKETAEVMYFIHPEHTGKGIGTQVLKRLESEARERGIRRLLADISSENIGSIRFHEKNGFSEYGRLRNIGRKFDRYFSVVYMGKEIV